MYQQFIESDFVQGGLVYASHGPVAFLLWLIAAAIAIFMLVGTALCVIAWVSILVMNVIRIYSVPRNEGMEKYHPYTQAILKNECKEMRRIRDLRALPKSSLSRQELKSTIQSVIDVLERHEREPIKYALIQKLKAL